MLKSSQISQAKFNDLVINDSSLYVQASTQLGFISQDQQEGLLSMIQIHGFFNPATLWQDVKYLKLSNSPKIFKEIWNAIKISGANKDVKSFNPKLLNILLGQNSSLDIQDMMDYILLLAHMVLEDLLAKSVMS